MANSSPYDSNELYRVLLTLTVLFAGLAAMIAYSSQITLVTGALILAAFGGWAIYRKLKRRTNGLQTQAVFERSARAERSLLQTTDSEPDFSLAWLAIIPLMALPFFAVIYFLFTR